MEHKAERDWERLHPISALVEKQRAEREGTPKRKPRRKEGTTMEQRPLHEIAREIRDDWGRKVNYAAVPYLRAMLEMESIEEYYGADGGDGIVARFLGNASSWRGDTARRVKAELKAMLKAPRPSKSYRCLACQDPEHDVCPNTPECYCCAETHSA
jgi:hypothetical protein